MDPMKTVSDLAPANDVNATGPMALEDAKAAWLTDAEHAISALAVRYQRTPELDHRRRKQLMAARRAA